MAEEPAQKAGAAKAAGSAKKASPPDAASPLVRDELALKFAGTATLVVGLVILVAGVVAIAALSILRFDVTPWLLIVPLALLVVAVGAGVNAHYRGVVDRILHPKPQPEPAKPPLSPYAPYAAAPMPYPYAPYPGAPAAAQAAPPAPAQPSTPPGYPPAFTPSYPPAYPYGVPAQPQAARYCDACRRPIPVESKFCPYCRRAYSA